VKPTFNAKVTQGPTSSYEKTEATGGAE